MSGHFRPGDRVRIRPVTGWSFDGALGTVESVDRRTVFVRPDGRPYSVECEMGELESVPREAKAGAASQMAMEVAR